MPNTNNYRTKSNVQERMENGYLFSTWTQTWGINIKPCYDMDKIRFSFIEKGKNGKGNSFNVDVPCKRDNVFDFINFAEEVLWDPSKPYKKCFIKVMAEEKNNGEKYPKRYNWRTGNNGEKSVGIANSIKGNGFVICGNNNTTNTHVMIPICDTALEDICVEFMETYTDRLNQLRSIRNNGIEQAANYFKNNKGTVDEDAPIVNEEYESSSQNEQSAAESKAPEDTQNADTETQSSNVSENASESENENTSATRAKANSIMSLYSTSAVTTREDGNYEFKFKAQQTDGTPGTTEYVALVDSIHYKGDKKVFAKFVNAAKKMSTLVEVEYTYEVEEDGSKICYIININL